MPIVAADLVFYASASKPEDDISTAGGAIDPDERMVFDDIAADDDIEVVSSNAGDTTQSITVYARQENGSYDSQTVTLNGTTAVILSTLGVVSRVLRALLSADAAGTVTVRRSVAGTTIGTIPPGERGFRRAFIKAFSDPGSGKSYYEKVFIKNTHATLALQSPIVKQNADPTGKVTHLPANAKNDSATIANRLTAPAAAATLDPDTFDDTDKTLPADLAAGDAHGVWLKLTLAAGDAPIDNTYTLEITGQTA